MNVLIHSARLDLIPMGPAFLQASLAGNSGEAARLLGLALPRDWPGEHAPVLALRLKQLQQRPALQPWLLRAIGLRDENRFIGHIGFHDAPGAECLRRFWPGSAEFGFWIDPALRRRGFAREAAKALMQWAEETQHVDRFVLSISPDNWPSRGLAEQLGFVRIGSHLDATDGPEDVLARFPKPPVRMQIEEVTLQYSSLWPGESERGFVASFHFRILLADGTDVGHVNFRVGETAHVCLAAGHVGFAVREPFRGHGYAGKACRALAPFVRDVSGEVTITCDPENIASRKTIERLGAIFMDEVVVPSDDPHYLRGSRIKRRYRWKP